MKRLYILGGIAVLAIVLVTLGSWFVNQNNAISFSFPSFFTQNTSAPSLATTTALKSGLPTNTPSSLPKTPSTTIITTVTTRTVFPAGSLSGPAPKITLLVPSAATVGSTVTIAGSGFDSVQNYILFGQSGNRHHSDGTPDNLVSAVASPDGKTLQFTIPSNWPSGVLCDSLNHCSGVSPVRIMPGAYPVAVQNKNGTSAAATFTVVTH